MTLASRGTITWSVTQTESRPRASAWRTTLEEAADLDGPAVVREADAELHLDFTGRRPPPRARPPAPRGPGT